MYTENQYASSLFNTGQSTKGLQGTPQRRMAQQSRQRGKRNNRGNTRNMQQCVASQNLQAALDNYESPRGERPSVSLMKVAI